MGQAIGATVEFAVAQLGVGEGHRQGIWHGFNLTSNHLVDAQPLVERRVQRVPVMDQALMLIERQHRQFTQAALAMGRHLAQQLGQMRCQSHHGGGFEARPLVAHVHRQLTVQAHQQRQRVVGLFLGERRTKAQTVRRALLQGLGNRIVFEYQQAVEQRFPALPGPALDVQQRGVLEFAQRQVLRLHRLQPTVQGLPGLWVGDHRQGVDEQADLLFDARQVRRTTGHRRAKSHGVFAGVTLQQQQPRGLHQRVDGDFRGTGEGFQTPGQRLVQDLHMVAITGAGRLWFRHDVRQPCRRLQASQRRRPERLAGGDILALQPGDVILITTAMNGHGLTAVALQHFAEQLRVAPAVHQDVMVGVDQVVALLVEAHDHQSQQGRRTQVQLLAFAIGQGLQALIALWIGPQVMQAVRQRQVFTDHLHRPRQIPLPDEPRAQDVMGVHRCLPSLAEAFRIQPLDVQAQLVDVIAADVTVDRMEQHPLLHRRQRIQVGDLRRRHRQPIQLLLVQARQGEVRRRHSAMPVVTAMLDQPLQLTGVIVGQGLDGGFVEHLAAEGPTQVQLAAEHLPVQGQDIGQRRLGVQLIAGRLAGRHEQGAVGLIETGVELAQVVERQARCRQARQSRPHRVIAQMGQDPKAQALVRNRPQLFLDLLEGMPQVRHRREPGRVQAGEPTDGAGQVHVFEQGFTAMAFELDQRAVDAGPAHHDPGQCGEQQVIDLGAIGLGRILQQLASQ